MILPFAITCAAVTVCVAFTVPAGSGRLMAAAALMGGASSAVWTFGRDVLVNIGGLSEGIDARTAFAAAALTAVAGAFIRPKLRDSGAIHP